MSRTPLARILPARVSFSAGIAAATAGVLAVSALVVPTAASAAELPSIAVTSKPGHPEIVIATVTSDSAVASVTAIVHEEDGTEVPVAFTKDPTGDTWTSEPVVLASLDEDVVAVVFATDADGDLATYYHWFPYVLQPVLVDHDVDTRALTFTHRSVTATGTIRFYDPRTRTIGPLPAGSGGAGVTLSMDTVDPVGVQVPEDGSFSLSTTLNPMVSFGASRVDLAVSVSFYGSGVVAPTFQDGSPNQFVDTTVKAITGPARLVFDRTSLRVKRGQRTTIRGVVQRKVGSAWVPVAGEKVYLTDRSALNTATRTGDDGRFFRVLKPTQSAQFLGHVDDPFLRKSTGDAASDDLNVWVAQRAKIKWGSRSIDADSVMNLSASLYPTVYSDWSQKGTVYLQESKNGKTGWRTLYPLKSSQYGGISAQRWIPRPSWKLRLVFKGNHLMQPTTSAVISTSRRDTRIIKARLSPSTLRKGRSTTISGVVQKLPGSRFVSVGNHQKVYIVFAARNSNTYTVKATTFTSSSGKFSTSVTATKDGKWAAVWLTNSSRYVHAWSGDLYVNVTGTATDALPVPDGLHGLDGLDGVGGPDGDSLNDQQRFRAALAAIG